MTEPTEILLEDLSPIQQLKLRRQVEQILTAIGRPEGADQTEGLARAILHGPHMAPYLLAWRYLLAMEIRKAGLSASPLH